MTRRLARLKLSLPLLRYISEVKEGSRIQAETARSIRAETRETSAKINYFLAVNHITPRVEELLGRRA